MRLAISKHFFQIEEFDFDSLHSQAQAQAQAHAHAQAQAHAAALQQEGSQSTMQEWADGKVFRCMLLGKLWTIKL